MRITIVSATEFEILPLLQHLRQHGHRLHAGLYRFRHTEIHILITGVGAVMTALQMGRHVRAGMCDLAINMGVAGSFNNNYGLGAVVEVVSDRFADLGVEENDGRFTDVFEMNLLGGVPFDTQGVLRNPRPVFVSLPQVQALTVNRVHGHKDSIAAVKLKYQCDVESMEGAAFMLSCLTEGVPFSQLRAVSNWVEPRNRAGWQLEKAIDALNHYVLSQIQGIV